MDLDVLEGGATRRYSGFMVDFGIDIVDYYAGWPSKIHGNVADAGPQLVVNEIREPIGVCGVITPWNGPSSIPLAIIPPLACGNSVVLKPAEQTPLAPLFVSRLCHEAGIPEGVINVVQGLGNSAGQALVEHPGVDAISFTGSVATGRKIQATAAQTLKRVSLELGGKSPHIIFADADLDMAVPWPPWRSSVMRARSASLVRACWCRKTFTTSLSSALSRIARAACRHRLR